ncbi:MAG TPA: hypothetical protein VK530_18165, partial [Candidatus Acidoferrum sp.]|nr:hypothetical protein [Candidatus Acidoferrum sp.]
MKKFWHRSNESNVVTVAMPPAVPKSAPTAPWANTRPASTPSSPRPATTARPAQTAVSVTARASTLPVPSVPGSISVTLGSLEQSLPEPLRHKIVGALHELVPVPLNKVLPQLHRGSVSLTVKELRECAPELLASFQGHDEIPITLPLGDVVRQIDPKILPRRSSQRRLEVPENVTAIFTQTSDGVTVIAPPAAVPQTPRPAQPAARSAVTATATTPTPIPVAATQPQAAAAASTSRPERISLSPQALAAL